MMYNKQEKRDVAAYMLFAVLVCGSWVSVASCYDPHSPNLPPCPDGGVGYTDPAGCFGRKLDGGPDAR